MKTAQEAVVGWSGSVSRKLMLALNTYWFQTIKLRLAAFLPSAAPTISESEDVEYEDLVEEEMEDTPENEQGESPPEVSPEELDAMDQEAAVEELNRLSKIGVIEEFAVSGASGEEKRMDLREVYDWRFRDGKWLRRCRIVVSVGQEPQARQRPSVRQLRTPPREGFLSCIS